MKCLLLGLIILQGFGLAAHADGEQSEAEIVLQTGAVALPKANQALALENDCPRDAFADCNKKWLNKCGGLTSQFHENDLSFCTVDPDSKRLSWQSTECMQGVVDSVTSSILGPAMLAIAAADAIGSACKGNTREFKAEVAQVKKSQQAREQQYMKNIFGDKVTPGTWESLSCDQLATIKFCRSYDKYSSTATCADAPSWQAMAESTFAQSAFAKTAGTSYPQIVVAPKDQSASILKLRLGQCADFAKHDSQIADIDRKYLRQFRDDIAKDGSCEEAFDSLLGGLQQFGTNIEEPWSEYRVPRQTPPMGCYSDEYLSERYCKMATDIASMIGPVVVDKAIAMVSARAASRISERTAAGIGQTVGRDVAVPRTPGGNDVASSFEYRLEPHTFELDHGAVDLDDGWHSNPFLEEKYEKPFSTIGKNQAALDERLKDLGVTEKIVGKEKEVLVLPGDYTSPLGQEMASLAKTYNVRFFDKAVDGEREAFLVKDVGGEVHVTFNRLFYEDPAETVKELKKIKAMLELRGRLERRGFTATVAPFRRSNNLAFQLTVDKNTKFAPDDVRLWIRNRAERHGVRVFVDDYAFADKPKTVGFVRNENVYLRSQSIVNLEESEGTIGHELQHAVNSKNCDMKLDCGPVIEFRGTADNPHPFSHPEYSSYFRSDEVESWIISDTFRKPTSIEQRLINDQLRREILSGQQPVDLKNLEFVVNRPGGPAKEFLNVSNLPEFKTEQEMRKYLADVIAAQNSRPYLKGARGFANDQITALTNLRKQIATERGPIETSFPKFTVDSPNGPIQIKFNLTFERTPEEARTFYLKMLDARIKAINMRLKTIEREQAKHDAGAAGD